MQWADVRHSTGVNLQTEGKFPYLFLQSDLACHYTINYLLLQNSRAKVQPPGNSGDGRDLHAE